MRWGEAIAERSRPAPMSCPSRSSVPLAKRSVGARWHPGRTQERQPGRQNSISAQPAGAQGPAQLAECRDGLCGGTRGRPALADIGKGFMSFAGLAHRMQEIGRLNGVAFINDSKATNADAAAKALSSFDEIYWIAGGIAKAGGIMPLSRSFRRSGGPISSARRRTSSPARLATRRPVSRTLDKAVAFPLLQEPALLSGLRGHHADRHQPARAGAGAPRRVFVFFGSLALMVVALFTARRSRAPIAGSTSDRSTCSRRSSPSRPSSSSPHGSSPSMPRAGHAGHVLALAARRRLSSACWCCSRISARRRWWSSPSPRCCSIYGISWIMVARPRRARRRRRVRRL